MLEIVRFLIIVHTACASSNQLMVQGSLFRVVFQWPGVDPGHGDT